MTVSKRNKIIAIIPARGGSKRIPQKNIIDFFGKPLIAWTIEAAIKSKIFDRIFVSTNNNNIAKIAKDLGVDVPFLRDKHSNDYSPVSKATITALQQVRTKLNEEYQTVVQLMPNCPLRTDKDIITSFKNFLKSNCLFQISCFKLGWINPWWAVRLDKKNHPHFLYPETFKKRAQDLPDLYCPSGTIWIANVISLEKAGTFYGNPLIFFPIDWKTAIDIDDMDDLEMAKSIYIMKMKRNAHAIVSNRNTTSKCKYLK